MTLAAWLEETASRAASARDYEAAAELLTLANAAREADQAKPITQA